MSDILLDCMVCGKEFLGKEPLMCCSGRDCGCMGLPVDPIVCSEECYNNLPSKKIIMYAMNDLSKLKESTSLSKKWIDDTNAKPIQVALWVVKNELKVAAIFWKGDSFGAWDDENAAAMTDIIVDLSTDWFDVNDRSKPMPSNNEDFLIKFEDGQIRRFNENWSDLRLIVIQWKPF